MFRGLRKWRNSSFLSQRCLPTSVDFDIEYEETSYVDIAHKYIMFLNNIYE